MNTSIAVENYDSCVKDSALKQENTRNEIKQTGLASDLMLPISTELIF